MLRSLLGMLFQGQNIFKHISSYPIGLKLRRIITEFSISFFFFILHFFHSTNDFLNPPWVPDSLLSAGFAVVNEATRTFALGGARETLNREGHGAGSDNRIFWYLQWRNEGVAMWQMRGTKQSLSEFTKMGRGHRVKSWGGMFQTEVSTDGELPVLACQTHLTGIPAPSSVLFDHDAACRILLPWPGVEPMPPAMEVQSLNYWTTGEVPTSWLLLESHLWLSSSPSGILAVLWTYWACPSFGAFELITASAHIPAWILTSAHFSLRCHLLVETILGYRVENCKPTPQPLWLPLSFISFPLRLILIQFSSDQLVARSCLTLCNPMDCSTPGLPAHKLMPIESVMPSNYLILCHPLLLPPSIFPSIIFSNESALHIRWPKYWSFSFSISLSNEY